ncbi:MAG TPA: cytochrome c maturation protein CcmE [Ktedonobacterales bacterium]
MTIETNEAGTPAGSGTTPIPRRLARARMRWSFLVAGIAIGGAILYLVIANTGASARYYMTVAELRACTDCGSQDVRVAGTVVNGSIARDAAAQTVRFSVSDGTTGGASAAKPLAVIYGGVVPDVFNSGVQVVVEGHLQSGVFHASDLLAKCPSKFQSATPATGSNP